jgi:hypothetical protein
MPNHIKDCGRIKPAIDTTRTRTSSPMDVAARGGSHGNFRISPMFVAMATVTRPASAADAPALATSRSFHASSASRTVMRSASSERGGFHVDAIV